MNTNITLFGKIAARSFLAWLSVALPGLLLSIAGLIAAIILFVYQPGRVIVLTFWPSLLLALAFAGFVLFPALASRYAFKKALYLCWDNKLGDYFLDKISSYLDRVWPRLAAPSVASPPDDATLVKGSIDNLKAEVRKDTGTNKLQKRILNYLLGKVRLYNIDWKTPLPALKPAMLAKVKAHIAEIAKPSALLIRLTMVLYMLVLVLALIYGRK